MGGHHCIAPRNGPAYYLGAKVVENGPACWRVLDDELEQLHHRISQASSGFDEKDSEVIRVRGKVHEDGPIPSLFALGPDLLDPRDASSWEDRVAVGVANRSGEVGRGGGVADGHVDVSPVGGGDETAVGPGRSRVPGECATGAKVGDRLPGADLEGSVVAPGFVAEVGYAGVVGRREHKGGLIGWKCGWRRRR